MKGISQLESIAEKETSKVMNEDNLSIKELVMRGKLQVKKSQCGSSQP